MHWATKVQGGSGTWRATGETFAHRGIGMSSRSHHSYQSHFHEAFGSGVISVSFQPPLLGCLPGYLRLAFAWKTWKEALR